MVHQWSRATLRPSTSAAPHFFLPRSSTLGQRQETQGLLYTAGSHSTCMNILVSQFRCLPSLPFASRPGLAKQALGGWRFRLPRSSARMRCMRCMLVFELFGVTQNNCHSCHDANFVILLFDDCHAARNVNSKNKPHWQAKEHRGNSKQLRSMHHHVK